MIDDGFLEAEHVKWFSHRVESDQFLYDLAFRSKDQETIAHLFKFIADKNIFSKIIDENGKSFSKLSESDRQRIVDLAQKFCGSLTSEPELYQAGELRGGNKFIVGIPSDENKLFIAWSNTSEHEYHRDIFDSLSRHTGKEFPKSLRSGGHIELKMESGKMEDIAFTAVLSGCSGDFGNYSSRILENFKSNLLETLQDKLGTKELTLEIKISD